MNARMQPFGPAVLRLAVGAVFLAHGTQKLFGFWSGRAGSTAPALFDGFGSGSADTIGVLVGVVELTGGLMLVLGAYTLIAAVALSVDMLVAIWRLHLPHGFFLNWALAPDRGHGYEFNLTLVAALVALMLTGAGAFSIDGRRARSAETEAAGRARLRAGKV